MSKKQTTTQNISPWAGAKPILEDAVQQTMNMGVSGFRVDPYQGQRVAQYSPTTMGGIDALAATANSGITPAAQNAWMSNLNMEDTYRDFDTIRGTVGDNVKAQLASTFAGGGLNSGLAQDTYSRALGEALAGVEYGAYGDAKARQMQALGMAPTIAGLGRADAGAQLTAGGMMDDLAQRNITADMQRYYEGENADIDALKQYSALASGFGGLGKSGSESGKSPMDVGGILGGGGALLYGLSAFSDRRLKKNIKRIGETPGGTPLYEFEYIWSDVKHTGVMADEVPHAIAGQVMGYDVVDYARVK